ncbi:fungal-specific transcription factor domain-containing protein [Rhizoctonia solani]|nr:fungal-specific transcription factor domain-containing protein [Rhizoctonia solani]
MGPRIEPVVCHTVGEITQESSATNDSNEFGLPMDGSLISVTFCGVPNNSQLVSGSGFGQSSIVLSPPKFRPDSSKLLRITHAFDSNWYYPSGSPSTSTQPALSDHQVLDGSSFQTGGLGRTISLLKDPDQMIHAESIPSMNPNINSVTRVGSEALSTSMSSTLSLANLQSDSALPFVTRLDPSFLVFSINEEERDNDPEDLKEVMWVSPRMDALASDNFLPSVLQNFARWVPLIMFEPLRITHSTKQRITNYFSSSDANRARIMLIGRVIGMLLESPVLDNKGQVVVSLLRADLNRETWTYTSIRPSMGPDTARIQAGHLLTKHLENITMQAPVYPLNVIIHLLHNATPIFRYACPDPPGLPIYLPGLLMDSEFNLRHFVSLDVVLSVTSGRPALCQYEVGNSLELCNQVLRYQEDYGFRWLHGVPDQFVLLLAWINGLYERQGTNVVPQVLAQIESDLSNVKLLVVESTDPALKIGRMVVQECWRHATYIYLYMTLYGAHSKDLRVERVLKAFMRLVNGVNPGRNPDTFLVVPMIIVGVAASKQRDRKIIQSRILSLRECQNPASSWNDYVQILEDIWNRASTEGRAAKWTDLRVACNKVTGI